MSEPDHGAHGGTFVDRLRWIARARPDSRAFTFLGDGETETARLCYAELDAGARVIAAALADAVAPGARALLLYPSGLDFIEAFFGCLYAGVVAVPAYPPDPRRLGRTLPRLQAIAADAGAEIVLSPEAVRAASAPLGAQSKDLVAKRWIATDTLDARGADRLREAPVGPETIAFLQYTSGSTGVPKGVVVSHGNLIDNQRMLVEGFGTTRDGLCVSWLPAFHDMGLIGMLLHSVFVGIPCVFMSPMHFLQRPYRWLQAITRYRATMTGAPNFAFDLCVRKIPAEERRGLDLSSLRCAFNGSEPVRLETLDRFAEAFAPHGLRREALDPCYGLAEATLIVSGAPDTAPTSLFVRASALAAGRVEPAAAGEADARPIVGCGRALGDEQIAIVDPETRLPCPADRVGEIWIRGPSVSRGYWNRPDESRDTCQARLADSGEGPFLRTGDLGFLHRGHLFVTGRRKDIVIIRGQNHYPQDIELTVERAHAALRPGCGAAFAVERDGEEQLVVAVELSTACDADAATRAIREAVAEEHGLDVAAIALIQRGAIPKTTSGKIMRSACRAGFLGGTLDAIAIWRSGTALDAAAPPTARGAGAPPAAAIEAWLVDRIAAKLRVDPATVDPRRPFTTFALDSLRSVELTNDLSEWLGRRVAPTLCWDQPTPRDAARHLAGASAPAERAPAPRASARDAAEPIAIIGIGCAFPGARGPEAFWRLLREGRDAVTETPPSRWDASAFRGPGFRWGGFLEDIDRFDPLFFGISPREAEAMDPQQRLLLEVAWRTLEDAGVPADRLAGSATAVYVGISTHDYSVMQLARAGAPDLHAGTGGAASIAANRISYQLDLRGPSVAVDTACSSSLVAVDLACVSLREGRAAMALAGGVNALLSPELTAAFSRAGFMAPDGRCKAFDARANGYVRSEGAGLVLLKPLARALADGDRIYAIVRGSAVLQDGRTNGLTAPSRGAQEATLRAAYGAAGVSPGSVHYVEAHGTGTALGDPIEMEALGAVLAHERPMDRPCVVGSVKTNLGHLEAAAGIAGLIKTALALWHGEIPPSLHFREPNPLIHFDRLPVRVATTLAVWPDGGAPRLAGVSSFGFGGTNAHVVLQGPPRAAAPAAAARSEAHLLLVSARSEAALRALAGDLAALLADERAPRFADVCFTAALRRAHHDHRLAVVVEGSREAAAVLDAFARGEPHPRLVSGRASAAPPEDPIEPPAGALASPATRAQMLDGLGRLHCAGCAVDWAKLYPEGGALVTLPPHPFQRRRYWLDEAKRETSAVRAEPASLLAREVQLARAPGAESFWEIALDPASLPFLADHKVQGAQVFPGTGHAAVALAAAARHFAAGPIAVADMELERALFLPAGARRVLQIVVAEQAEGASPFAIWSRPQGELPWTRHVTGRLVPAGEAPAARLDAAERAAILARCREEISGADHYAKMTSIGNEYGPRFQGVQRVFRCDGEALGEIAIVPSLEPELDDQVFHPALLDACGQVLLAADPDAGLFMPVRIQRFALHGRPTRTMWSHARLVARSAEQARGEIRVHDDEGRCIAEIGGVVIRYLHETKDHAAAGASDMLYEVAWRPVPRDERASGAPARAPAGAWLIFADRAGVGGALASLLRAQGHRCVLFESADHYDDNAPDLFRVDPSAGDDVRRALGRALAAEGPACAGIVHLWSLDAPGVDGATPEALARAVDEGCASVLDVARGAPRIPLWLVTRGAQAVEAGERVGGAVQAALWGLGRTLGLERPSAWWGGLFDLDPGASAAASAAALVEEIAARGAEAQIALRGDRRYAARLARRRAAAPAARPLCCRTDATYLITGGLGGLGLEVARGLVARGARRLLLLGRTPLPARERWRALGAGTREAEQVAAIRALEALGASVHGAAVDVADEVALRALLERFAAEAWPPVRGVVHAAGVVTLRPTVEIDRAALRADLGPKLFGAVALHRALAGADLDFFILYSSVSAILPSPNLASYAAANASLDGFARYRRGAGRPALSIAWGAWAEVGMAARLAREQGISRAAAATPALAPDQALEAQDLLVREGAVEAAVLAAGARDLERLAGAGRGAPFFAEVLAPSAKPAAAAGGTSRDALLGAPDAERRRALFAYVATALAATLDVAADELSEHQTLDTLGIDSMMAIELQMRIEKDLGVEIPLVTFLKRTAIAELVQAILGGLVDASPAPALARPAPPPDPDGEPLSVGQQGLWFLYQLARESAAYNVGAALRLRRADVDAVRKSFQALVDRHPSLRTTFTAQGGVPRQRVPERLALALDEIDASAWPEASFRALLTREAERPFHLERGPVMRLELYRRGPDEHVLLLVLHHIAMDFWSLVVMISELGRLYAAFHAGAQPSLPPLPLSYLDFVRRQDERLRGPEGARLREYWRAQLAGAPPTLDLPTDRPRPPAQTFVGASRAFLLGAEQRRRLEALCEQHGVTLFTMLLSMFAALLSRRTGQRDLLVASLAAGRTRAGLEGIVGYFVNILPMRAVVGRDDTFAAFLARMREVVLGGLAHQDYPFARMVEELVSKRDPGRAPLCQVMFVLQKAHVQAEELNPFVFREDGAATTLGGLHVESMALEQRVAQFDMTLMMAEVRGGIRGQIEYNTDLFDAATIDRWIDAMRTLVDAVIATPDARVCDLPAMGPLERRQVLVDWNDTAAPFDARSLAGVHRLFEAQADRTPDAIAVASAEGTLTYRALDRRADRLARRLQTLGVGPGALVGVYLERSLDLVSALLAVLKAGGAYVPLDPDYPRDRVAYMLEDARASVVLTHERLADRCPSSAAPTLVLKPGWHEAAAGDDDPRPGPGAGPGDLAYVLHTSGSTGRPRGVMITHRALCNQMLWMQSEVPLDPTDRVLQKTPLSFDASVWEIYLPLLSGARLVLAPPGAHQDIGILERALVEHEVTILQVVPRLLRALLQEGALERCAHLRRVFCGGEALPRELRDTFLARSAAELYNLYGPTEATIQVTSWRCRREDRGPSVPIGRPVANTQIYVLDEEMQPLPVGRAGELYIAGAQLARGYLNDPELTAARLLPSPFSADPDARVYRTRDLGRHRSDGALEYLGRLDHQVKLHGFRIELEEIEALLQEHPSVRAAAAAVREDASGAQRLVAYVVPRAGAELPPESVAAPSEQGRRAGWRAALAQHVGAFLPEYMVPSVFVPLGELPISPNGKLDRRALPAPPGDHGSMVDFVPSRTPLEQHLAALWSELLGRERVGVHDDFFDLGGHSLLAMRLAYRIGKELGVDLPVGAIFQAPTVAQQARLVRAPREAPVSAELVCIQRGDGAGAPLFLVHAVGGTVFSYVQLAKALAPRAVHGIQALDGAPRTIPEMAERYAALLRAAQPEGPYAIGGWSMGGLIALEVARKLRAEGDEVRLVALLDTHAARELYAAVAGADQATRLGVFLADLERSAAASISGAGGPPAQRLADAAARLRATGLFGDEMSGASLGRLFEVYEANAMAASAYTPLPYDGRITLLRAEEGGAAPEPWAGLAARLQVALVPGDHFTMLHAQRVGRLAEILREQLSEDEPRR